MTGYQPSGRGPSGSCLYLIVFYHQFRSPAPFFISPVSKPSSQANSEAATVMIRAYYPRPGAQLKHQNPFDHCTHKSVPHNSKQNPFNGRIHSIKPFITLHIAFFVHLTQSLSSRVMVTPYIQGMFLWGLQFNEARCCLNVLLSLTTCFSLELPFRQDLHSTSPRKAQSVILDLYDPSVITFVPQVRVPRL